MEYIRRNIKIFVWLILPAYFLVLENSIRNKHTHVLASGLVIVHTHPVKDKKPGKPFNQHKHTKAEIFLFQLQKVDSHNISSGIGNLIPGHFLINEIYPIYSDSFPVVSINNQSSRAPPFQII